MTTEFENLAKDFVDWLDHPLTKKFVEILELLKSEHLQKANELSLNNYHKMEGEVRHLITLLYGKVDGIMTITSLLRECKDKDVVIDLLNKLLKQNEE